MPPSYFDWARLDSGLLVWHCTFGEYSFSDKSQTPADIPLYLLTSIAGFSRFFVPQDLVCLLSWIFGILALRHFLSRPFLRFFPFPSLVTITCIIVCIPRHCDCIRYPCTIFLFAPRPSSLPIHLCVCTSMRTFASRASLNV